MGNRAKALMVLGTASHVGKSLTVAALCRIFHQEGLRVAPFKAQNMALNSFATREGHEIGRAQAVQAQAAGIEPHVDMNPILLKPSSETGTQVILNGTVFGTVTATEFRSLKPGLVTAVVEAYERLAARYEVIILEGAGSPVEMNLKDSDIVNLYMAEIADAPCLLVADIDRGGVFASLVGTYALLTPSERRRFGGFLINKFRGDESLFHPGVAFLEAQLHQRCLGVVPYQPDLRIEEEDSVALDEATRISPTEPHSPHQLCCCVIQFPHISNFSDFAALEAAPEVTLVYARTPAEFRGADVLILPGSKSTIADLCWLRATGWSDTVLEHANAGKPVIGICGGFQMLGQEVRDPFHVEGTVDHAPGVGLLDVVTSLTREKVTRQAHARLLTPSVLGVTKPGPIFDGYEIHLGETRQGPRVQPLFSLTRRGDPTPISDGAVSDDGRVIGTYLHGLFDAAEGMAVLLAHWRRLCHRPQPSDHASTGLERERQYEALADHFRRHLDLDAIYRLMGGVRRSHQRRG